MTLNDTLAVDGDDRSELGFWQEAYLTLLEAGQSALDAANGADLAVEGMRARTRGTDGGAVQ